MRSQVSSILRNATRRDGEPLNILCVPTHESNQTEQAKTGHKFYMFQSEGLKSWNSKFRPLPPNCTLLEPDTIPSEIDFDLILSQNNWDQYPILKKISVNYNVPLVNFYHTCPHPSLTMKQIMSMKVISDADIFISAFSRKAWGFDDDEGIVVHHGINTELFRPRGDERDRVILSVVNKWEERDAWCGYGLWRSIVSDGDKAVLPVRVFGDNPGMSQPAETVEKLAEGYSNSLAYLNTSLVSPIPTSLMEGAASGCVVISTDNCAISEIFTNGSDSLLSNDPKQLRRYCELVLTEPGMAAEYGRKARETITTRFSLDSCIDKLNAVFYGVLKR